MALPRQLPTTHDGSAGDNLRGPYFSAAGAAYYVARDDSALAVDALKSSDPATTAFAVVDGTNNPTTSTTAPIRGTSQLRGIGVKQVGDVLTVLVQSQTIPAMGDHTYYWDVFSFDMSTDTWTTTGGYRGAANGSGASVDPSIDGASQRCDLLVRDNDGDIAIVGVGPDALDMGTAYGTQYHGFWNGSTWSTPTRVDGGTAAVTYTLPSLSLADYATDGDYVAFWIGTDGNRDGRAITGASHTHETSGNISGGTYGPPPTGKNDILIYDDGTTWRGFIAMYSSIDTLGWRFDPTATEPFASETSEGNVMGEQILSGYFRCAYDPDTDTRYTLHVNFSSPNYRIRVSKSTALGAWTTSTFRSDTTLKQLTHGSPTIGTSPSDGATKVIGFIWRDNGAVIAYYDEISLATPAPPFPPLYSHRAQVPIPFGG